MYYIPGSIPRGDIVPKFSLTHTSTTTNIVTFFLLHVAAMTESTGLLYNLNSDRSI